MKGVAHTEKQNRTTKRRKDEIGAICESSSYV